MIRKQLREMNKVYITTEEHILDPASKTFIETNGKDNASRKENFSATFVSDWASNQRSIQKNKSLKAFSQSHNLTKMIQQKKALYEAYAGKRSRMSNLKTDDPNLFAFSEAITTSKCRERTRNRGATRSAS